MTVRNDKRMIRPELVGGTFLAISLLGLPATEYATRLFDSQEWLIFTLAVPATGVALLVLPAWLRARPVRKLFEHLEDESDNAFVSVVASWDSDSYPDLQVLTMNSVGMGLHTADDSQLFAWPQLGSVSVEPKMAGRHPAFSIVTEGRSVATLTPMHLNGRSKLSSWKADEWASELRRHILARQRSAGEKAS